MKWSVIVRAARDLRQSSVAFRHLRAQTLVGRRPSSGIGPALGESVAQRARLVLRSRELFLLLAQASIRLFQRDVPPGKSLTQFVDSLRRTLLLASCALTVCGLFAVALLLGGGHARAENPVELWTLLALLVTVEYAVGAGLNPIRIVLSAELMPNAYRSLGMSLGNATGWLLALASLFFYPLITSHVGGAAPQVSQNDPPFCKNNHIHITRSSQQNLRLRSQAIVSKLRSCLTVVPQFGFFGGVVAALTVLLVWQLPETKGIDFSEESELRS